LEERLAMESCAAPGSGEKKYDSELAGAAQRFTHTLLAGERSAATLAALVSAVAGLAAGGVAANRRIVPDIQSIACKTGCNYCCYLLVTVAAPEVLTVLGYIVEKFSQAEIEALKQRVEATDEITHGLSGHGRHYSKLPCPLLVGGKCSVYEVRPLVCRGYTSYSWTACADSLLHPRTSKSVPIDWGRRNTFGVAQDGMITALHELGFEKQPLELIAALKIALKEPDIAERWLGGEAVFTNAEEKIEGSVVRRSIDSRMYDTSQAETIAKYVCEKPGEPYYREETLYRAKTGEYFLGGIGGEHSYYAQLVGDKYIPGEDIIALRVGEARRWLEDQGYTEIIERIFGTISTLDYTTAVSVHLTDEIMGRAERAAAKSATSVEQWIEQLIRRELSESNQD
jgi:hypothetical protein